MANEYLKRTPTSTGNRRVWTWSGWIKFEKDKGDAYIWHCTTDTANHGFITYRNGNIAFAFNVSSTNYLNVSTVSKIRDFSSWTNLIVVLDTTQTSSRNRYGIYINGIYQPLTITTEPTINISSNFNTTAPHFLGVYGSSISSTYSTEANIADVFFIDGQALTPDVFGFYKVGKGYVSAGSTQATDFRPGQWVPKTPRVIKTAINNSGGFGVNGFYLPMNDSNNFGADFHCEPNSIIKLQENLPQPRSRIDGVGDYTGALRDDPFKQYLVLALPFVSGGLQSGFGDYSAAIKGSGSAKTLTNTNVSIASTASYYGNAGLFNGTSSQLTIPASSDFDLSSTDFTIEMWANPRTLKNGNTILSLGTGGNALYWVLYVGQSGGEITIGFGNGGWGWTTSGSGVNGAIAQGTSVKSNQWNHVAVVRKSNILTAYVNGTSVGITTNFNFGSGSAGTLYIGSYFQNYNDDGSYWDGYIQDLRIYKGVAKYKGGFDVPRPYTPVGIATWRAVPDSPANNFATLNPLIGAGVNAENVPALLSGNLYLDNANQTWAPANIGVSTGKWYAEFMCLNGVIGSNIGVCGDALHGRNNQNFFNSSGVSYVRLASTSVTKAYTSTGVSGSLGYTSGDIVGVSIDVPNREFKFYKNNTLIYTDTSASSYSPLDTNYYFTLFRTNDGSSGADWSDVAANFGQNPSFSGNTTAGTYTDSNNKGLFKYQPPSGFLALCEDNLPTPAISDPGKHFKTVLYTGDGNSGRSIVGVGFTPDLVWIKARTIAYNHRVFDSVRGAGKDNFLLPNSTAVEGDSGNYYGGISSFDADGFSMVYGTGGSNIGINASGENYVAWCWRAGAGTTSTNTNGSITSVVSVNQDAGFSIVSGLSGGSGASSYDSYGHGLGKTPSFILVKNRDTVDYFYAYHKSLSTGSYLILGATNASAGAGSSVWGTSGVPTSSVITVRQASFSTAANQRLIFYCWAEIEGFSKFGSYTGNGSADGPFVYCGFRPAWVMIKRTDSAQNWPIIDSSRDSVNVANRRLFANLSDIEDQGIPNFVDILSNGFKCRDSNVSYNASGGTYIFVAFAESPFQTANAK